MAEKKNVKWQMPGEYTYNGVVMCGSYPESMLKKAETFPFRDDDVVVATYPKSGTHWTMEITWLVQNNGDIEGAKAEELTNRVFSFPRSLGTDDSSGMGKNNQLAATETPRIIKTHLWVEFFENTLKNTSAKFIVIMRNPKDVFVSYYHLYTAFDGLGLYTGTWDEFFEDLVRNDHLCWGSWFDYQVGWWKYKDSPNVLILKYEDMITDLGKAIRSIANFLGKKLQDDVVEKIVKHTSFDQMKENTKVNKSGNPLFKTSISPFMRKGKVGDWKNYYSKEQSDFIDKRMEETLAGTGLTFDFE